MKNIYVGNLPFNVTEEEVRKLFEEHGTVHSLNLIVDRDTGQPRGFGFVEMEEAEAAAAITALDGRALGERSLKINEARPRQEKRGNHGW